MSEQMKIPSDNARIIIEELHNLYTFPSIIRMIKSKRMRWAGHVARMGEEECIHDIGCKARS
jgi:hypothetical protein